MKNDNIEAETKIAETELEAVQGGAQPVARVNLDSFITLIGRDRLRAIAGMDRPKGLFVNVRDQVSIPANVDNVRLTRGQ